MATIVSTGVSTTLVQHAAQLLIVSTTFVCGIIIVTEHIVNGSNNELSTQQGGRPFLEWAAKQILL